MSNRPLIFSLIFITGHLDGDNVDDKDEMNVPLQEMSAKPAAKAFAAATAATKCKAAAGKPMTGETEGNFLPSTRTVSKLHGFGTKDVYAVLFDSEGTTDYCIVSLYLTGIVPEGGSNALLSLDGFMILWSRPVDAFLFSQQHLKKIMGEKYSDTHIQVRSFDQITQAILGDKNKAGARDLIWGKPQDIHLKNQCTGNVTTKMTPYPPREVPTVRYKSVEHRQFNTIVELKVKLAAQHKTAMK